MTASYTPAPVPPARPRTERGRPCIATSPASPSLFSSSRRRGLPSFFPPLLSSHCPVSLQHRAARRRLRLPFRPESLSLSGLCPLPRLASCARALRYTGPRLPRISWVCQLLESSSRPFLQPPPFPVRALLASGADIPLSQALRLAVASCCQPGRRAVPAPTVVDVERRTIFHLVRAAHLLREIL